MELRDPAQVEKAKLEDTLMEFYYKVKLPIQNYDKLLQSIETGKIRRYLKAYDRHTSSAVLNFVQRYKRPADLGRLRSPY